MISNPYFTDVATSPAITARLPRPRPLPAPDAVLMIGTVIAASTVISFNYGSRHCARGARAAYRGGGAAGGGSRAWSGNATRNMRLGEVTLQDRRDDAACTRGQRSRGTRRNASRGGRTASNARGFRRRSDGRGGLEGLAGTGRGTWLGLVCPKGSRCAGCLCMRERLHVRMRMYVLDIYVYRCIDIYV